MIGILPRLSTRKLASSSYSSLETVKVKGFSSWWQFRVIFLFLPDHGPEVVPTESVVQVEPDTVVVVQGEVARLQGDGLITVTTIYTGRVEERDINWISFLPGLK